MCKPKEFIQCRNCPRLKQDGPKPGFYYEKIDGKDVVLECDCHKKWRLSRLKEIKLTESGITMDYTFNDYVGTKSLADLECLKKIAKNPDKYSNKKMIYIWGPNGCQKTSMVQALGRELIEKNFSVQYTTMDNLITSLVSDFSRSESDNEKREYFLSKCMDCDFLIIDESFDLKKTHIYVSGYQVPYLDSFLRNRFDIGGRSIIFVSNVSPRNIADLPPSKPGEPQRPGFGESIQNLVQRNVRESELIFRDVWVENVNSIDRTALFNG